MSEKLSKKEVAERATMRKVRQRLEEKEFVARCNAVKMCYRCGSDWKDIEPPSNHHVSWACTNKRCSEYNIVKKHIYPN